MKRLLTLTLLVGLVAVGSATAAAAPISWQRCAEPAQKGFDCARIRVPLDHDRPGATRIELALIRHSAADRERRLGTIFYEPGGPGTPGTAFLPTVFENFPAALRARFDIVSWDPRGVGASTAVQCFADHEAEEAFFAGAPTRSVDGFPIGRAQMETWIERYRGFGARCKARAGHPLAHVSTLDTVRDLDLMRRWTGEPRLNYVGTSYGTIVGAVYANVFPNRVRAMALDGVVDPIAWSRPQRAQNGGRHLPGGLRFRSDEETVKTLRAFLDLCGRTDVDECAFSAGSRAATRAKFRELLTRLPVDAGRRRDKLRPSDLGNGSQPLLRRRLAGAGGSPSAALGARTVVHRLRIRDGKRRRLRGIRR